VSLPLTQVIVDFLLGVTLAGKFVATGVGVLVVS
jgi:hypothetical protein